MKDNSPEVPSGTKRDNDKLPANLDKLKDQLEQLAANQKATQSDNLKDVAQQFGGR